MRRVSPGRRAAPRPASSPRRPSPLWLYPALAALTLAAYFPAWHGSPLWDDDHHLTAPALRGLEGLWRIWFDLGATQQYYPLVHSAFWIQHRLWGDHTLGYHLVSILLHASSAGLVWVLLRRLAVPGAALAAAAFALHPIHVESVAWMTELKNTLSGVFVLWAALRYLAYDETRGTRAYVAALTLLGLALLSKTVTAVMPAAMLVIFWWKRGALDVRRDVRPLVPFFVLGAAAGLLTAWVERTYIGAEGAEFAFSPVERVLIAGRVVWFYVSKLLWPADLIFTYPRWTIEASAWWQYLYPLGGLAALAGLWTLRTRNRAPLAAALLFGGILFPVLGFFNIYPFRFSFVADHFAYLASIPVLALVAAGFAEGAARWGWPQRARAVAAAILLAGLGVMTFQQSGQYADAGTLYRETLRRNPSSWMAHGNLGMLLLETDPSAALRHFDHAIRLHPGVAESRLNRGNALQRLGRVTEAITEYRTALAIAPRMAKAHNNLSSGLLARGDAAGAMTHAQEALRLQPDLVEAHYNAGRAARLLGRFGEAISHLNAALEADAAVAPAVLPELALAHNELGVSLARDGRIDAAVLSLREAIRMRPAYGDAHFNLANVLLGAGRAEEAVPHYETVLTLNPDDAFAYNNLGTALERLGRRDEAIARYREAIRLAPGSEAYRANLRRLTGQ